MRYPLISILLPTYNRAYVLGRTINNIIDQTWKNWELIVVDDNSTDDTEKLVAGFKDKRIRYIKHKTNKGEAAARNTGGKIATGVFIANQDSDDLWEPTKLEEEISLLSNAPADVGGVYSQTKRTFMDGRVVLVPDESAPQKEGNLHEIFLRGDFYITSQAITVRKQYIENIGWFDENLRLLNDAEFCIRFSQKYKLLYNPRLRVISDVVPGSQSQNPELRLRSREYIFNKHRKEFTKYPAILAKNAYSIGNAHALRGELREAHPFLRIAKLSAPRNIKYSVALFLSLIPIRRLYKTAGKILALRF